MNLEHFIALVAPHFSTAFFLAVVATIGYLVGRSSRREAEREIALARREIERARAVANELEKIANDVHKSLTNHKLLVARFKNRVSQLGTGGDQEGWKQLWKEAEEMLGPTQRLASQIATAYEEIRQQATHLMAFTEVRTDTLTGVRNRRALDEVLDMLVAMHQRYGQTFSVAIFDVDHFKNVNDRLGHLAGDRVLRAVAAVISDGIRQTDVVARYGGEEFVVAMPETKLEDACVLAERLRQAIERHPVADVNLTISGGVATICEDDDANALLARADEALYRAKNTGRNQVCFHCGTSIQRAGGDQTQADDRPQADEEPREQTAVPSC